MAEEALFLFDADETLWTSSDRDWVGSVPSNFTRKEGTDTIRRDADGKEFTLRRGTREALDYLQERNIPAGIISDNIPEAVQSALNALGIANRFAPEAVNVRLWQGYCPKDVMIGEVLAHPRFAGMRRDHVVFLDDKDYSNVATQMGIQFDQVTQTTNLLDAVQALVK